MKFHFAAFLRFSTTMRRRKTMKQNQKNNIFAGTFLGEVAKILAKGKFTEPDEPVAEGEEVIGEMTLLEKAVFHLVDAQMKEAQKICEGCDDTEEDKQSERCRGLQRLTARLKILSELRWALIRERLRIASDSIGVRQGYKIVKLPAKKEDAESSMNDSMNDIIMLMLDLRFGNIKM
jgi:hypothetical protein